VRQLSQADMSKEIRFNNADRQNFGVAGWSLAAELQLVWFQCELAGEICLSWF